MVPSAVLCSSVGTVPALPAQSHCLVSSTEGASWCTHTEQPGFATPCLRKIKRARQTESVELVQTEAGGQCGGSRETVEEARPRQGRLDQDRVGCSWQPH